MRGHFAHQPITLLTILEPWPSQVALQAYNKDGDDAKCGCCGQAGPQDPQLKLADDQPYDEKNRADLGEIERDEEKDVASIARLPIIAGSAFLALLFARERTVWICVRAGSLIFLIDLPKPLLTWTKTSTSCTRPTI